MNKILLAAISLLAIGTGAWFGFVQPKQSNSPKLEISGFAFPIATPLSQVSLVNQEKKVITENSFKGNWTFVYVGYTFCPDACPMAMTVLNQLHGILKTKQIEKNVQMMLVSVDPDRDTPEKLRDYVTYFNSSFSAATGTPENIKGFAKQLSSFYSVPEDKSDPNYIVDHSSSIILIDPNAAVHAIFTTPQIAVNIADDFQKIEKRYTDQRS